MAYKTSVEEQKEFEYEFFNSTVKFIEDNFKDNVLNCIGGKYIWVLLDGMYDCSRFTNTTVSDVRAVCGEINIDCITNFSQEAGNILLYSLREPSKKSFRGKIKYTPKGTISMSWKILAREKNGKSTALGEQNVPILQNEKLLQDCCKLFFENDVEKECYEYVEQFAFKFLNADKRISCSGANDISETYRKWILWHSKNIQRIISLYFTLENSWGVCLYHGGNCFIFPMKREYIQKIFRNRDKEDGRRRVIASVVKDYTRKNGTNVDGHLRSKTDFTMDGRRYKIFVGAEDLDRIFPNTDKSRKRMKKWIDSARDDGKYTYYRRDKKKKEANVDGKSKKRGKERISLELPGFCAAAGEDKRRDRGNTGYENGGVCGNWRDWPQGMEE